jgi:hypothetical protein
MISTKINIFLRCWTDGRAGAIPPHGLYLLVIKGVTRALPNGREGRKREENGPIIIIKDLF